MGGVTLDGFGTSSGGGKYGAGNVFELTFGTHSRSLYVFNPTKALGYIPLGPLLQDSHFNLYGTTSTGGVGREGAVFELIWNPNTGRFKPVALHGFSFNDGGGSASGLVMDAAGNLYGTTVAGGTAPNAERVVFKLTPGPKNVWPETVLYSFNGDADGGAPYGTLISDTAGNLYGTGIRGGDFHNGVVFEVIP